MRNAWRLSIGLLALALVSCAKPGGIYRAYEGPERDLKDLAVLNWSAPAVSHIDGYSVQRPSPRATGVFNTIAHLAPGPHKVRIRHHWEDLYYKSPNSQYLDLRADFLPGRSYMVREAPCKNCDPFSVVFWIADAVTGVPLSQTTMIGGGPYGEAAEEAREEKIEQCKARCGSCYYRSDDYDECEEKREECEKGCDPFRPFF